MKQVKASSYRAVSWHLKPVSWHLESDGQICRAFFCNWSIIDKKLSWLELKSYARWHECAIIERCFGLLYINRASLCESYLSMFFIQLSNQLMPVINSYIIYLCILQFWMIMPYFQHASTGCVMCTQYDLIKTV